MKPACVFLILLIGSCNNSNTNNKQSVSGKITNEEKSKMSDEIFKKVVIIILAVPLTPESRDITIQDYIENGKSFVPIFSSIEKFNESTKGVVKNQKIEINGFLLLSLLRGNETVRLNPGLQDDVSFHARDLIEKYSAEIQETIASLKKGSDKSKP